ncbi:MAG: histidine phosphatase family protein [Alphaproteobacteria bacterium]|nr:histidine phosphatase family protein [Alphaproteobacteria bacterium]
MENGFEFGVTPFYFLRHGETDDSRTGVLQGQRETQLNAEGLRQAERVGRRLVAAQLGSIHASPLARAWKTASIVSLMTGAPAYRVPGLMERHWGIYEGQRKGARPNTRNPDTVETVEAFAERVLAAMKSIKGPLPALIVAHSGVFRAIGEHIGLRIDTPSAIGNDQLVLLEPAKRPDGGWHISEV